VSTSNTANEHDGLGRICAWRYLMVFFIVQNFRCFGEYALGVGPTVVVATEKRRKRREWYRCGESAVTRDWDSEENMIRRMGAKWVQGRFVRECECYSPLEVTKLSEEIDTAVVSYRPSFILLVHYRRAQRGMKFGCVWVHPIDNND